ncbi:MAG TPA: pirin family protein [Steroidobacteraceae bacterium]|nr:pirin family protein [Steroidobacteraceae bacterium]
MNAVSTPAAERQVVKQIRGMPTSDGAGVKLTRVIGQPALQDLDPFLLLDEFGTDHPGDYIAGFPAHPHRGFETVTYMLDGRMRHQDNHGHEGVLVPGAVQWMTAGRGIVHSEMPEQQEGRMRGFQLWLNLPAQAKMIEPAYQELGPERIPLASPARGVQVKVIAGKVAGVTGPVVQPATDPTYLDVELDPQASLVHTLPPGHSAFVYVFEGALTVGTGAAAAHLAQHTLAVLGDGAEVRLRAADLAARAILVAGRPLREPVARYGPFVMNTQDELRQAYEDYRNGRF